MPEPKRMKPPPEIATFYEALPRETYQGAMPYDPCGMECVGAGHTPEEHAAHLRDTVAWDREQCWTDPSGDRWWVLDVQGDKALCRRLEAVGRGRVRTVTIADRDAEGWVVRAKEPAR